MDAEQTHEVLDYESETPQQEDPGMEKVSVPKLDSPEESMQHEKSPATEDAIEQLALNGHDTAELLIKGNEVDHLQEMAAEFEKPSENNLEVETEVSSPKEMSEQENVQDVPAEKEEDRETVLDVGEQPESDGPLEKSPDTELGNAQLDQEPVPAKSPEPLPLNEPLADDAPDPEPEKLVEPLPEAAELSLQTPSDAVTPQPEEDKQVTPVADEPVQADIEADLEKAMDAKPKEIVPEVGREKDEAVEPVSKMEHEEKVEPEPDMKKPEEVGAGESPEAGKETVSDEPAKTDALHEESAGAEKETEPEKPVEMEPVKVVESAEGEAQPSEQHGEQPTEEEEKPPAPGSLSFAILEQEHTKVALQTSLTLIVLRGLPGSGKSYLARAIADCYQNSCSVFCADDHGVKPEDPEASTNGYKALDEALVACCSAGTTGSGLVVVVDDTNHTQDRLARLGEIAEKHQFVAMFLEPRTEWNRDSSQLVKKTGRGLEEAQIQAMKGSLEDVCIPSYFGWFLNSSIQSKVRCTSMDFLKTLDTLEAFKKHLIDFTGEAEKEVDLEQYFQPKGTLHCTTKYCDYGRVEGSKEYAEKPAVQELYGSAFELSLTALFVTPRTVGARVSLSEDQLVLWPDDAEKEAESAVPSAGSLPRGSRAHVTLGCAEGVEAVQTGFDLLEILALQQEGQQGEPVEEMELGSLTYFDKGRWLLSLREPIAVPACFSSVYEAKKAEQVKKEAEKKKKKCTIL